ncbi:MAG: putative bifunctional diguanylate cyclase/phosphodiesterase, partial [Demequina sp.]
CNPDSPYGSGSAQRQATGPRALLLRSTLRGALERQLLSGDKGADMQVRETIDALVDEAVRLINLGDEALSTRVKEFTGALLRLNLRPDTLRRFMDAMRQYAQHAGTWVGPDATGGTPVSPRISASLWRAQAGALLNQTEAMHVAAVQQYAVDAGLLETGGSDPRDLAWLAGTRVRAAALGLWKGDPADQLLTVVGEYEKDGAPLGLIGTELRSETFPPQALIARASTAERETCVVVPVGTGVHEWGLLSVIVEIDPAAVRDTHPHWAALLSAALESRRRLEKLRHSALFDPLTDLPNRQLFIEHLDQAIALHQRSGTPFSVLFLDLDGFKLINDSLGHQMGDRVLTKVASEISRTCRDVDTAARFGGDEFVVLLADTGPAGAIDAARRLQVALDTMRLFDGHEIVTRASIGIASSSIGYTTSDEVLRDADAAMYRAKAAEPGSVAYFDAPMHASAVRQAKLADQVLHALQEKQFEVHYQPIVNLDTGQTDRFEALVRWNHPEQGLIEPREFLADIEETSLIIELGHWVLDEVCRQLAEWSPRVANVSVNISDKEFWSQNLLTRVLATLEKHGLPPHRLTLEITESVLMRRPELALRIMSSLHEAGLTLHLDEFGTGYSSLDTLHRFPVDAVKIDRSFIHSLTVTEDSSALISSLVALAKSLGLSVVAEGVETDAQLALLQQLGCATGQGFLFMPAVSADVAGGLLGHPLRGVAAG